MKYLEVMFNVAASQAVFADATDLVAALAGEAGFESFEYTDSGLKGYVQKDLFSQETLNAALADFPIVETSISYSVKDADDRDWNEQWEREGFLPIYIIGEESSCAIYDGRHLPEQTVDMSVEIDARLAFGTGNHETTRMVASQLLALDLADKTMLDAGCGTGVLGIIALKRGAAHVTGYDIDQWSVDNARHNAVINNVAERFSVLLGDSSVIPSNERYDVVTANINRNILLHDLPRFAQSLKANGLLILSGFYTSDVDILLSQTASLALSLKEQRQENGWACLMLVKTA